MRRVNVRIGTSGYAYKEWKGDFYPEKISPKEMLRFYSERLDAVEINNTFYRMPTGSVLTSWARQVPEHFIFAVKAPQLITHVKRLIEVEAETEYLFKSLSALDRKQGPVLFQLPKSFRVDHTALKDFLSLIPHDVCCAFAFRSASWLDDEILDMLRERGCSLCVEDTDEDPASAIIKTATWGYLRLRRSDYTDDDLSGWAEEIGRQGWERTFVFFKHENEAKAPKIAARFRELFGSSERAGGAV